VKGLLSGGEDGKKGRSRDLSKKVSSTKQGEIGKPEDHRAHARGGEDKKKEKERACPP